MNLKLENYRASKLDFENKIEGPSKKFQVKQSFNTRVNYIGENKCACVYNVKITDVDDELSFHIEAEIIGFFSYADGLSKVDIHVEAARQLFPYLKSTVSMLTTLACAPPFNIQNHEVRPEDVVGSSGSPSKVVN